MRILIVEDNPADLFVLREAFRERGVTADLDVLEDGEAAAKHIVKIGNGELSCPNLLILDLNLPRIEGSDLLAALRSTKGCETVPVLIFTSSDAPKDRALAAEFNAFYFRKPTDLDEFLSIGDVAKGLLNT